MDEKKLKELLKQNIQQECNSLYFERLLSQINSRIKDRTSTNILNFEKNNITESSNGKNAA